MTHYIPRAGGQWQNLAKGLCPFDSHKLRLDGKVLACDQCDYYITPLKLREYLTNPDSAARKHMSKEDRERIDLALAVA